VRGEYDRDANEGERENEQNWGVYNGLSIGGQNGDEVEFTVYYEVIHDDPSRIFCRLASF